MAFSRFLGRRIKNGSGTSAEEQRGEHDEGVFVAEHCGLQLHLEIGAADGCLHGLSGGHASGNEDLLDAICVGAEGYKGAGDRRWLPGPADGSARGAGG